MKPEEIKSRILKLLSDNLKGLSIGGISESLDLKRNARKRLQRWLQEMVVNGEIFRSEDSIYRLGPDSALITGIIETVRSGNAFLAGGINGESLMIPREDLATALNGDKVLVRIVQEKELSARKALKTVKKRGKVIKVIERSRHDIVGTLKHTGKFYHVVPIDPSYRHDFYVQDTRNAKVDDRVVIRLSAWKDPHLNPEAEIVEVIGPSDEPSLDTLSVIRQFRLSAEFTRDTFRDAETVSQLMDYPENRQDITDRFIITIDPERARDFDDALSMERDSDGMRVLGVHIADVGHFVRCGTAIDREAFQRGTSVYFPDKVIPMLPEQLSNGICSLKPNENRFAFSAFIKFDERGVPVSRYFRKTIIRSSHRLTYEQAYSMLNSQKSAARRNEKNRLHQLLFELNELAQQMRKRRFGMYALDLDVPESEIVMGTDGMIKDIRIVENDISHQLVEECMVAANEAVAAELSSKGYGLLFRRHDPPTESKIEELTMKLYAMGFKPGNLVHRKNLSDFLKSVSNHPLAYHIRVAVLRSMNRAVYANESKGHYGLAKTFYCHFTSPIRRYPDLIVHRQLARMLFSGGVWKGFVEPGPAYSKEVLSGMGHHCSMTEQNADDAERAIIEIKKYRFLEKDLKSGHQHTHDAVVVNVTNFGIFVELLDLQIQGLIHISALSDRYVRYDAAKMKLMAGRTSFAVGTKVKVNVVKVDFDNRRVDFVIAKGIDSKIVFSE